MNIFYGLYLYFLFKIWSVLKVHMIIRLIWKKRNHIYSNRQSIVLRTPTHTHASIYNKYRFSTFWTWGKTHPDNHSCAQRLLKTDKIIVKHNSCYIISLKSSKSWYHCGKRLINHINSINYQVPPKFYLAEKLEKCIINMYSIQFYKEF